MKRRRRALFSTIQRTRRAGSVNFVHDAKDFDDPILAVATVRRISSFGPMPFQDALDAAA